MCHSHDPKNRTCHWGFDSENWRAYLHLAEDYTDSERDKLAKIVADFKNRYKPSAAPMTSKRKTVRQKVYYIKHKTSVRFAFGNSIINNTIHIYTSTTIYWELEYICITQVYIRHAKV